MEKNVFRFGYPEKCIHMNQECKNCNLIAQPFEKEPPSSTLKVMLIGRDPRIDQNAEERVSTVLMLDTLDAKLPQWILNLLGAETFFGAWLYATNVVKCTLQEKPTDSTLRQHFTHCGQYLKEEVEQFQPHLVISFGGLTHELFHSQILSSRNPHVPPTMKQAFTGELYTCISPNGRTFTYSPCLHITQFNLVHHQKAPRLEVYNEAVKRLPSRLREFAREI